MVEEENLGETLIFEEERREKRRGEIPPPLTHACARAEERGWEREGRGEMEERRKEREEGRNFFSSRLSSRRKFRRERGSEGEAMRRGRRGRRGRREEKERKKEERESGERGREVLLATETLHREIETGERENDFSGKESAERE